MCRDHRTDFINDKIRQVHSAQCQECHTAKQFSAAEMNWLLDQKVIEPVTAELAETNVFFLRKDVSLRFCIDYWKLNVVMTLCLYPLTRMNECIDRLGQETMFSRLQTFSRYRKKHDKHNREYLVFMLQHALYRFTRIALDQKNSPETF